MNRTQRVTVFSVALLAGSFNLLGCSPQYDKETQDRFLAECVQTASRQSCQCAWDAITGKLTVDEFRKMERQHLDLGSLPDQVATMIEQCGQ